MRALAVAIVFVSHAGLGKLVPGGLGVSLFFFLSGYLITSLMRDEFQRTGNVNIRNFYLRRSLRILPSMWIAMAFALLLDFSGFISAEVTGMGVVAQLAFLTNYADLWGGQHGVPGIPLWSLAVEEHFYLLFPLVYVLFLSRVSARKAALACVAACIAFLIFRLIEFNITNDIKIMYYRSHLRMDSILFGCILALWENPILDKGKFRPPTWIALLAALLLLIDTVVLRNPLLRETIRYSVQGICMVMVYSFILSRETLVNVILRSWPMQIVGRYSYVIYLVHVPILMALQAHSGAMGMFGVGVLGAILTLLLAAIIHQVVEKPAARLRHHFATAS
jgi:peptidoglycan/LPS O-acetylase OafA/YrhL